MDAAGMLRPLRRFAGAPSSSEPRLGFSAAHHCPSNSRLKSCTSCFLSLKSSGFSDRGHLDYYYSDDRLLSSATGRRRYRTIRAAVAADQPTKAEEMNMQTKKKMKKRLKLLKCLSKDLSALQAEMGPASDSLSPSAAHPLIDQVKGKLITEAAEVLLAQLEQLRAEEKELKRKRKEEKAKLKAAARVKSKFDVDCGSSSSSSSESSSDDDCKEVVNMNTLRCGFQAQPASEVSLLVADERIASTASQQDINLQRACGIEVDLSPPRVSGQINNEDRCRGDIMNQDSVSPEEKRGLAAGPSGAVSGKKIEVCMGGKCRKSGAPTLLEEFQRAVGDEGQVCGCKCMGRCKDGPNVRVLSSLDGHQGNRVGDSAGTSPSLCIGVGLEDVGLIVSSFLSENVHSFGVAY